MRLARRITPSCWERCEGSIPTSGISSLIGRSPPDGRSSPARPRRSRPPVGRGRGRTAAARVPGDALGDLRRASRRVLPQRVPAGGPVPVEDRAAWVGVVAWLDTEEVDDAKVLAVILTRHAVSYTHLTLPT